MNDELIVCPLSQEQGRMMSSTAPQLDRNSAAAARVLGFQVCPVCTQLFCSCVDKGFTIYNLIHTLFNEFNKMAPPSKKRKIKESATAEIIFDPSARFDYLTGFHKRKVQRLKQAQEAAARRARQEKIDDRKKV